jgi:hypothetical protein
LLLDRRDQIVTSIERFHPKLLDRDTLGFGEANGRLGRPAFLIEGHRLCRAHHLTDQGILNLLQSLDMQGQAPRGSVRANA